MEVKPLRELTGNALFNTVFIDDVFVPDELVLGQVDQGWGQPQYPYRRTGFDRAATSRGSCPALTSSWTSPVRGTSTRLATTSRQAHRRGPRRQTAEHALDTADPRRRRRHAVGGYLKLLSMRTGQGYAEFAVSRSASMARSGKRTHCRASGRNTFWPAVRRRSTAAPRRCSSTSSLSGCWACPRPVGSTSPRRDPRVLDLGGRSRSGAVRV